MSARSDTTDIYVDVSLLVSSPRHRRLTERDVERVSNAFIDAVEQIGYTASGGFKLSSEAKIRREFGDWRSKRRPKRKERGRG